MYAPFLFILSYANARVYREVALMQDNSEYPGFSYQGKYPIQNAAVELVCWQRASPAT